MKRAFLAATLGIIAVLAATETAQAQMFFERGRGGPSLGIGMPFFGRSYSYYYDDGGTYRSGFGPGFLPPPGFGPGFLPPPPRLSLGLGGPLFRSGFFGGPAYYDSGAGYVTWGPDYVGAARDGVYRSFYQPPTEGVERAMIRILVPVPDARIWFDGTATERQGVERAFVSPALEGGADHTYSVRASWTQDGREVTREAEVKVRAGHQTRLSFLADTGVRRARFDEPRIRQFQAFVMSGKVVSTADGQLVMTDLRGNRRHTHRLSPEARVFIDGKEAAVADLKEGMRIEVTTKEGQPDLATRIEARTSDQPQERLRTPERAPRPRELPPP